MKDFLEPPPNLIACHRVSDFLRHGKSQPGSSKIVRVGMQGEKPASVSSTLLVNPLELRRVGQSRSAGSGQSSDSQLLAPSTATGGYNSPPTDRAHALPKPVGLSPLATIWLISTLHKLSRYRKWQKIKGEYIRSIRLYPTTNQVICGDGFWFADPNIQRESPAKSTFI